MTRLNHYRAARFEAALRNYATDEDPRTVLVDLLTDARHWCDRHSESYGELDRMAREHYSTETVVTREGRP